MANAATKESPKDIDSYVLRSLLNEVESDKGDLTRIFPKNRLERMGEAGDFLINLAEVLMEPARAFGIAGLSLKVVRIVTGISRKLGVVKPDYRGPQWPFLYAFGRTPWLGDIKAIRRLLTTISRKK